jgi:hypothetical protein
MVQMEAAKSEIGGEGKKDIFKNIEEVVLLLLLLQMD